MSHVSARGLTGPADDRVKPYHDLHKFRAQMVGTKVKIFLFSFFWGRMTLGDRGLDLVQSLKIGAIDPDVTGSHHS